MFKFGILFLVTIIKNKKSYMIRALLGTKIGMTQVFDENGNIIPITIIQAGPCYITQVLTKEKNGYEAVQIGYHHFLKKRRLTKPEAGHLKINNLPTLSVLKEIRTTHINNFYIGQELNLTQYKINDLVSIKGTSIGKGTAGNIKRHHFNRGPMSHGSKHHRLQGSLGAGTSPGRVFPGKRMPGRLGNQNCTIKNLKIVNIILEKNLLMVKGAIPGKFGNLILIKAN